MSEADPLALLPVPSLIEELDYETTLTAWKNRLVAKAAEIGIAYDVESLATDPAIIIGEAAVYAEMVLRARGNDIARAPYLAFNFGNQIDNLAVFYDVARIPGESDDRFKARIILAIRGRSTGGTEPRYKAVAMAASLRVAEAVVYTVGTDPTVNVAIFATDNNGVADAGLLALVDSALQNPAVRMVNDRIVVRAAVVSVVPVVAAITLQPTASTSIITSLQNGLAARWAAESGMGRDLTLDWLTAALTVAGVHSVSITAPGADVVMQPFEAVRIGAVTLTLAGRDF
jgi:phage-related baseplate assembly protein